MPMTLFEAAKLTTRPLASGVLREIVKYDEFMAALKFEPSGSESIDFLREKALAGAEFMDPDGASTPTESASTADRVSVPLRALISDVDIPVMTLLAQGGSQDQASFQIQKKAKAVGHKLADKVINGGHVTSFTLNRPVGWNDVYIDAATVGPHQDTKRYGKGYFRYTHAGTLLEYRAPGDPEYGPAVACAADGSFTLRSWNPNKWIRVTLDVSDADENGIVEITFVSAAFEPDGLELMIEVGGTQDIPSTGADGDPFTLAKMDALITAVKINDDRVFMMSGKMIEKFLAAYRASNGTDPNHLALPGYSGQVMVYRGFPVLRNDNVAADESKGAKTNLSSIYFGSMGDEGLMAIGLGSMRTLVEGDPRAVPILGLFIEALGTLQTHAKKRWRMYWFGAFKMASTLSWSRAREIQTD